MDDGKNPASEIQAVMEVTSPNVSVSGSVNHGGQIRMPNVTLNTPIKVAGQVVIDRGDKADFEVLHHRVGAFRLGDRISASDLPDRESMEWLINQEAIRPLRAFAKKGK